MGKGYLKERTVLKPNATTNLDMNHKISTFDANPVSLFRLLKEVSTTRKVKVEGSLSIEPIAGVKTIPFNVKVPLLR